MRLVSVLWISLALLFSYEVCATSLGVWPINPRIDAPASATLVWVKNNNKAESVILQARIFSWSQVDDQDKLDAQDELVVSPPLIEVKPGSQQIFRIMNRRGPIESVVTEAAYRLIIDEVPREEGAPESLLRFQMRYSLPLFVGLPDGYVGEQLSLRLKKLEADLRYRIVQQPLPSIEIFNQSPVHARLSHVVSDSIEPGNKSFFISQGLLGYVLPYSSRKWPLAKEQADALKQGTMKVVFEQEHQELTIAVEK